MFAMAGKAVLLVTASLLLATAAVAQNNRSAVSLTGLDTNSCTVPDPCRTFGAALARTNAGGEVIVLSSAGYGPFTVNQSVSIISSNAFHAALAPTAGDAITVDVDNAVVVLRGLTLNGSLGGGIGIKFIGQTTSGSNTSLYIENCNISGFSGSGINLARNGRLYVHDTTVRQNGFAGILIEGSSGLPSQASLRNVILERNVNGLRVDNASVAVRNSVATSHTGVGFWARAELAVASAVLSVENCQSTHNNEGFTVGGGSGPSTLIASNSTATQNSFGFLQGAGGTFESRGNNNVRRNTTNKVGTITVYPPE